MSAWTIVTQAALFQGPVIDSSGSSTNVRRQLCVWLELRASEIT